MDRAVRLAGLWSWLPAFRAVAETEHLPTAAKHLHVTPSAVSRSVSQLEDALGQPLFLRTGRRLRLAPAGRLLLDAVRDAMRGLDDRLAVLGGEPGRDRVRVAAAAPWLGLLVVPALPGLAIDHVTGALDGAAPLLIRGELDLAIGPAPSVPGGDDRLVVEPLGEVDPVIACAPTHPLARRRDALASARFAVCTAGGDAWPPEAPRVVALTTPHLDAVLDACAAGELVAVVPGALARARRLRAIPEPSLRRDVLYLVRRRPLGPGWLDDVAARVRAHAADHLMAPARRRRRRRPTDRSPDPASARPPR